MFQKVENIHLNEDKKYTFPVSHTIEQKKKLLEYIHPKSHLHVCGTEKKLCSKKGTVIITFVDSTQVEMFQNWNIAIKRSGITKVAVIAFSTKAAERLKILDVDFYHYDVFKDDAKLEKKHKHKREIYKLAVIATVLNAGYAVLHSGVNVVFLKNPFPHFNCHTCDFEIMNISPRVRRVKPNFDLCVLKPVNGALKLLKLFSKHLHSGKYGTSGNSFSHFLTGKQRSEFYFVTLNVTLFSSTGYLDHNYHHNSENVYTKLKYGERLAMSSQPKHTVSFHIHWEKGSATHRYIFRELGLWYVDNNKYYSEPSRKYIIYGNYDSSNDSNKPLLDVQTFHCAFVLSKVINRTLILPRFHCRDGEQKLGCTLLSLYRNFDRYDMRYSRQYREHSFLTNPLVPKSVVQKQSPLIYVPTIYDTTFPPEHVTNREDVKLLEPKNQKGPSMKEFHEFLDTYKDYSVIRFYNLHFACFTLKSASKR